MANSRSMYMAKKVGLDTGDTVTFTPSFGCNTWQLRFISRNVNDDAYVVVDGDTKIAVSTIDEEGHEVFIDDSPFAAADFPLVTGLANGNACEVTLDSTNPSVKVTVTEGGAQFFTVLCKAYRHLEDIPTGSYSTTDGVS